MNTRIRYSKKRSTFQLVLGSFFIIIGLYFITNKGFAYFNSIAYTLIGLIYYALFLFESKKNYIELNPSYIRVFSISSKKVKYEDIQEVYILFGDYIIQTSKEKIVIDKKQMHKEDISKFEDFFLKQQQKTIVPNI